jgi:hypothetical protein
MVFLLVLLSAVTCKVSLIYSRPTYHGRRILPHRIKEWLRNRGLHWPCFCSLTFGGSSSSRIVEALSGSVCAFCNSYSSGCGFRSTSRFEDGYSLHCVLNIFFSQLDSNLSNCHVRVRVRTSPTSMHVPTSLFFELQLIFSSATGAPDMASLRTEFRSIESTEHGPYYRGYCGEHESEYQGTTQLAGTSLGKPCAIHHLLDSQIL